MPRRSWLVALLLVVALQLSAHIFSWQVVASSTQVLLVPTLAGCVWSAQVFPRGRLASLAYAGALFFSWLGDSIPQLVTGDSFLVMVGCFLVAQVLLIITFIAVSATFPSLAALAAYGLAFLLLFYLCAPGSGSLLPFVGLYGLALVVAAACASTINAATAVGGAFFVLSDSLIGLHEFAPWYRLPQHDFFVMATYSAAQVLIAWGLLHYARAEETHSHLA